MYRYYIPEKLPIEAKKLIGAYEKGEYVRDAEESKNSKEHPEMYDEELASPGTTKNLKLVFEKIQHDADTAKSVVVLQRSTSGKQKSDKVAELDKSEVEVSVTGATDDRVKQDIVEDRLQNGIQNADETTVEIKEVHVQGHEVEVKEIQVQGNEVEIKTISMDNEGRRGSEMKVEVNEVNAAVAAAAAGDEVIEKQGSVLIVTVKRSLTDQMLLDHLVKHVDHLSNRVDVIEIPDISAAGWAIDVEDHRSRVRKADLVIFHYEEILHNLPARLMLWMEKIFEEKFAYDVHEGHMFDDGLLKNKRALLVCTTMAPRSAFTSKGILGDVNVFLWPIQNGILRFVGFDVLPPVILYDVRPNMAADDHPKLTSLITSRVANPWNAQPIQFIPKSEFTPISYDLSEAALKKFQDRTESVTCGQHLGKRIATRDDN